MTVLYNSLLQANMCTSSTPYKYALHCYSKLCTHYDFCVHRAHTSHNIQSCCQTWRRQLRRGMCIFSLMSSSEFLNRDVSFLPSISYRDRPKFVYVFVFSAENDNCWQFRPFSFSAETVLTFSVSFSAAKLPENTEIQMRSISNFSAPPAGHIY